MSKTTSSSDSTLPNVLLHPIPHQLFHGTTWHSRLLPSVNKFAYPYRYWGVNISALAAGQTLPEVTTTSFSKSTLFKQGLLKKGLPLFSAQHRALQQFCADDYLIIDAQSSEKAVGDDFEALKHRLEQTFIKQTGSAPLGDMIGMMVCRNAGLYFSPVNFYLGFDNEQTPTHLLAEVSNTPWDKRHYYGFLLEGADTEFCHDKDFHVSPFNPIDQQYRWQVSVKKQPNHCLQVRIAINISDARGEVLKTGIKMTGLPLTNESVRHSLRKNPLMNITSLTRIYWHAFKLYAVKKVPYINYDEKLADSKQQERHQ
ncbi:DUF1365 domain-containing protein [Psychrobacter sp. GP33]|uniref:DUF1365 domain-containing protein n=1 Tax=Psychrobacter sp. GP33 TaxID=2758709 RepID=UPI0015FC537C|nr:DUF1365 domain-containing protein [Psychrobacter sp. GP33]